MYSEVNQMGDKRLKHPISHAVVTETKFRLKRSYDEEFHTRSNTDLWSAHASDYVAIYRAKKPCEVTKPCLLLAPYRTRLTAPAKRSYKIKNGAGRTWHVFRYPFFNYDCTNFTTQTFHQEIL